MGVITCKWYLKKVYFSDTSVTSSGYCEGGGEGTLVTAALLTRVFRGWWWEGSETEWVRTGIDERMPWKLCCTWTVLKDALGWVVMVTAWGCSGDSAFVLSSLETSAVVTTGVLDFSTLVWAQFSWWLVISGSVSKENLSSIIWKYNAQRVASLLSPFSNIVTVKGGSLKTLDHNV